MVKCLQGSRVQFQYDTSDNVVFDITPEKGCQKRIMMIPQRPGKFVIDLLDDDPGFCHQRKLYGEFQHGDDDPRPFNDTRRMLGLCELCSSGPLLRKS